jgi:hypothetical protein
MPVSSGNIVTAAYYNTIQSTLASVVGTGSGSQGWGQTVSSTALTAGTTVAAAHWNKLYTDINKSWQQIYGVSVPAGTCPTISSGNTITASVVSLYESSVSTINSNRLTMASGNGTLTSAAYTNTRASTWSAIITATFNVTWASEDAARFFFNSGGYISLKLAHPNTSTPQDTSWNTMLTNVGTLNLLASSSTQVGGTLGTINSSLGYYGLTSSAQAFFTGSHIGSGAYVNNDCNLTIAKITNGLQITVTLNDEHTNSFYDIVQAGTNVVASHYRATAVLSGITSPTFTTVTNF